MVLIGLGSAHLILLQVWKEASGEKGIKKKILQLPWNSHRSRFTQKNQEELWEGDNGFGGISGQEEKRGIT